MIHIDIICIGKVKEKFLKEAIAEYSKRLQKYCILNIIELNDEPIPISPSQKVISAIKQKESDKLLSHIKKDSFTICLDLNGKDYTSEEFSKVIQDISLQQSHITFLIGGTLGMSQNLLSSVKSRICFSKMTFPHPLIRVFLLEQLFRAFKISNGETYHR